MNRSIHKSTRIAALAAMIYLVALPRPAFANHGLAGLGDALEMLAKILMGTSALSFILAWINIRQKSVGLRILSILFMLPLVFVTLALLVNWPVGAFVGVAVLLLYGVMIYKSIYNPADHETDI